jgi:hypothetical protein
MENFKLLKGYRTEIIISELNPDLSIKLETLPDNMLKIRIKYVLTSYGDSIESEKIVKMKVPFSDYIPYSDYILSINHLVKESLNNDIMDTFNTMMNNFD